MIRPLGRGSFAIWIIGTVLGFVALTVGFPFFVAAVVGSCSADTCGAIMLVASSIVKPLLFWLFIVALLVALAARLRDVGVSPWLSAGFIFLMFVDHGFLLYAGSGWAFPMSMGVLSLEAPVVPEQVVRRHATAQRGTHDAVSAAGDQRLGAVGCDVPKA